MSLETILALYILLTTSLFGAAAYRASIVQGRGEEYSEVKAHAEQAFAGNLFTHPSEGDDCELTDETQCMPLRLTGYNDDGEVELELDAPANGWTHAQIAAHIIFNQLDCWDARLGDNWIGSSEV